MTHEERAREFFGCLLKEPPAESVRHGAACSAADDRHGDGALSMRGCVALTALLSSVAAEATAAERERAVGVCERIREQERNRGEDCPSGGWGGYKLGAMDCAAAIRKGE